MSKIVFGSYLIRYPLGGMASYVLQYLIGLHDLGHDVVFVEKAEHPNACFDPVRRTMTDDPSTGLSTVAALFERFGLNGGYCFVDYVGNYYGMSRRQVEREFAEADAFLDMGTHGAWLEEASSSGIRVLLDGEPGYNHIKMERGLGGPPIAYDVYVTNGLNIGTEASPAPTAGVDWHTVLHPVVTRLYEATPPRARAAFSTVMNWSSHARIEYQGATYGQKDVEFEQFIGIPPTVDAPMEIAVAGADVPRVRLETHGWRVRDGHSVTATYDRYHEYIDASLGEFAVCKNVFVALRTAWFSDRSAAYLAHGRPVVLQDTGFSRHLPTGRGLFAVRTPQEAVAAIREVVRDFETHSLAAREIAEGFLDAPVVLRDLCRKIGV